MNLKNILERGVDEILPSKENLEKLLLSKKLRIYLGIDPTGTKLHLGHTIPMRKLAQLADLGHEAILLFGTGTVLAGDPSQRLNARKRITQSEIDKNIKTWKKQASKIIDLKKIRVRQNGDWLLKLNLEEIVNIASNLSAIQMFKRDMFQKRLAGGNTVWFHETMYPMLQGYDSVAMDVDLEVGGTDQTFNMLIGRELQKKMAGREKYVLTTPLILGTDNNPMSKSSGNCIWLDETPNDMYGKIMSISDDLITSYWANLTDLDLSRLKKLGALDAKKELAREIVSMYHSNIEAEKAQQNFENVVQKKQVPKTISTIKSPPGITIAQIGLKNKLFKSMSDAKNMAIQGGLSISYDKKKFEKIKNPKLVPGSGKFTLKIGTVGYYDIEEKE